MLNVHNRIPHIFSENDGQKNTTSSSSFRKEKNYTVKYNFPNTSKNTKSDSNKQKFTTSSTSTTSSMKDPQKNTSSSTDHIINLHYFKYKEHVKWVLYEYRYPIHDYKKRIEEGNHQNEYDIYPLVSVFPSEIDGAGKGLFAERTFKKGDCITSYCGNLLRKEKNMNAISIQLIYMMKKE